MDSPKPRILPQWMHDEKTCFSLSPKLTEKMKTSKTLDYSSLSLNIQKEIFKKHTKRNFKTFAGFINELKLNLNSSSSIEQIKKELSVYPTAVLKLFLEKNGKKILSSHLHKSNLIDLFLQALELSKTSFS